MNKRDYKTIRRNELLGRYENKNHNKKDFEDIKLKEDSIGVIISSYNRYDKLINIIKKINSENNSIEINILDDGSTDDRYKNLSDLYNNVNILKNEYNYGRKEYWKSINKLFNVCKTKKYEMVIQIDDDFILCDNFIKKVTEKLKKSDCCCFHYQYNGLENNRWGLKDNWVDGGIVFKGDFLKKINYEIKEINKFRWNFDCNMSSGVWHELSKEINKMGLKVLKTKKSYVLHDGNDDSKMNSNIRKNNPIYSKNFIDGDK